ncbi:MAG: hypothetical protein KME55_06175 [Nostoc indistinguendum CM1-VF10]|nr:hypothetical protein [Nostoc indistinguendum CM1-VF10]
MSIDENLRYAAGLRQVADNLLQKQCVKEIAQFRRDRLTLALAFLSEFAENPIRLNGGDG